MAKVCSDQMIEDDIFELEGHWVTIFAILNWLQTFIVIVCVIIVFGYYRKLRNPDVRLGHVGPLHCLTSYLLHNRNFDQATKHNRLC